MPRKKSTIPPAARIRENQRRSRARRKELVEDLQHRLREYEKKETQATLAMQLAARRVAWENTQLRDLLASNGVSCEEIEGFLRDRECTAVRTSSDSITTGEVQMSTAAQALGIRPIEALRVAKPADQILPITWQQVTGTGEHEDSSSSSTWEVEGQVIAETPIGELHEEVPPVISPAQKPRHLEQAPNPAENNFGRDASDQISAVDAEQDNMLPIDSDWLCPDPPTSTSFIGNGSALEMSCEIAAGIISRMREDGDREQARSQLGCGGRRHCNVKNIKVLQVMEMD